MGLPARRMQESRQRRGSHLRVVKAPATSSKRRVSSADAAALGYFRIFAVCMVVLATAGLGRVWVAARAAQLSRESTILRESIRTERYEGDILEVRESALGSPSRIRTIASKTMGMKPAGAVTYLDITAQPSKKTGASKVSAKKVAGKHVAAADVAGASTLQKIMDLTAGEAQVLLVGDVALASSRK
ncbi:MAG TPA: hypothetical protein VFG89_07260 [Coriobacteriia bacterium]|nr:hypothetical protein [Coriobacteriia bacterium]